MVLLFVVLAFITEFVFIGGHSGKSLRNKLGTFKWIGLVTVLLALSFLIILYWT